MNAAARCLVPRRSRRGERLPLEGFALGTRDLDLEVRQRHFERRGQQRGRQEEQRIPACHVSFLFRHSQPQCWDVTQGTDGARGPHPGEEASSAEQPFLALLTSDAPATPSVTLPTSW